MASTTLNLFPHLSAEEIPKIPNSSVTKEPKVPQLTIFYCGQVIVFDDVPADKAMEIMSFASKGAFSTQDNQSQPSFPPNSIRVSSDSTRPISPSTANTLIQRHPQSPPGPGIDDLPIARKFSLHRFLEKRKDRIAARSPYQISKPMEAYNKPKETMPCLGLAARSPQC
ncbi:protein TIFY 10A-like [Senna tora]|uniref:Protein TIFY n=1 Tax=Senna tora TaxID=362788 RepID=A0A834TWE1_9FABA|nr:protein TIFY 10A-like [Senna tora]